VELPVKRIVIKCKAGSTSMVGEKPNQPSEMTGDRIDHGIIPNDGA